MAVKRVEKQDLASEWPVLPNLYKSIIVGVRASTNSQNVGFVLVTGLMPGRFITGWARKTVPVIGQAPEGIGDADALAKALKTTPSKALKCEIALEFGEKEGVVFINLIKWVEMVDL